MTEALPLAGHTISRVIFDYAISFGTVEDALLRVESRCEVLAGDATVMVDPAAAVDHAPLFIRLLHQVVDRAEAEDGGLLRVEFANGTTLVVPPDDAYEAWTCAGNAGQLFVCLPGGGLSTWGATGSPAS